ncbi:uncharacterized protein LOC135815272 [Sycon ciliatum]|uniref:uncharacterized protein LOC135815272 n=1 Tax=Sycon ciliatum TaxID=27933 RepID=UPI0031F651E7
MTSSPPRKPLAVCATCRDPGEGESDALAAVRRGHIECLQAVCAERPGAIHDVNSRVLGVGVLHVAASQGHTEVLRWLCEEAGVVVDISDVDGATPTHLAAANGNLGCVRYLIGVAGADVHARMRDGGTPLMLACQNGHEGTVEWLIGPGRASLQKTNSNNATAVHLAAAKGHSECLKLLTKARQYKPNEQTKDKATPVYFAAQEGHLKCLKWLLEHGKADLAVHNDDGRAPIHAAATSGHLPCLQYLLAGGGGGQKNKRKYRSVDGATALHFAAAAGQMACVRWLVEQQQQSKANKLDRDDDGGTPMHDAAEHNQVEVLRYFIECGFDVDARDDHGRTPMHIAQENGHDEAVDLILEHSLPTLQYPGAINLARPQSAIYKAEGRPRRRKSTTATDVNGLTILQEKLPQEHNYAEEAMPPKALIDTVNEAERLAVLEGDGTGSGLLNPGGLHFRKNSAAVLAMESGETPKKKDKGGKKSKRRDSGLSQVDAGDEVFDLSASSPAMMSDDENRRRKRGIFKFFGNFKRKPSSQSLVNLSMFDPAGPKSPSAVSEGGKTGRRKFGFKLSVGRRRQSSTALPSSSNASDSTDCDLTIGEESTDGGDDMESPVHDGRRFLRRTESGTTIISTGTEREQALSTLLEQEDREDMGNYKREWKVDEDLPEETEEERADRKRREFESLMFGNSTEPEPGSVQSDEGQTVNHSSAKPEQYSHAAALESDGILVTEKVTASPVEAVLSDSCVAEKVSHGGNAEAIGAPMFDITESTVSGTAATHHSDSTQPGKHSLSDDPGVERILGRNAQDGTADPAQRNTDEHARGTVDHDSRSLHGSESNTTRVPACSAALDSSTANNEASGQGQDADSGGDSMSLSRAETLSEGNRHNDEDCALATVQNEVTDDKPNSPVMASSETEQAKTPQTNPGMDNAVSESSANTTLAMTAPTDSAQDLAVNLVTDSTGASCNRTNTTSSQEEPVPGAAQTTPQLPSKNDRLPSTAPLESLSDAGAGATGTTQDESDEGGPVKLSKQEEAQYVLQAFKARKEAERKAKLQQGSTVTTPNAAESTSVQNVVKRQSPGASEETGKRRSSMSKRLSTYLKRRRSGGSSSSSSLQSLVNENETTTRNRTGTVVTRGSDGVFDNDDDMDSGHMSDSDGTTGNGEMTAFMAVNQEHLEALEEVESAQLDLARRAALSLTSTPILPSKAVPELLQGIGLLSGLELWTLSKSDTLTPLPVTDDTILTAGELYICLRTRAAVDVKHVIHLWIGKEVDTDRYQALLEHAHAMEKCLPGLVIMQRETQGYESALFLSYFKHGLICFMQNNADVRNRLFHIQGLRHMSLSEVQCNSKSLNKGDTFLLKVRGKILVWFGPNSEEKQQKKALAMADWLAERKGGLPVRKVDDNVDNDAKKTFWQVLGSKTAVRPAMLGRGVHRVDRKKQKLRLFNVLGSGEKGKLKIMEVKTKSLHWSMLPADSTAVMETDSCMYVWSGAKVMPRDLQYNFQRCDIVVRSRGMSSWLPVVRIRQHGEPSHFRQFFLGWPSIDLVTLAKFCGTLSQLPKPEYMIDRANGHSKVYTTHSARPKAVQLRQQGQFSSTESYVVEYRYRHGSGSGGGGGTNTILYAWHGRDCSAQRSGQTMAVQAQMARALELPPVQTRLSQGHESDHFLSVFRGQLVIYLGTQKSSQQGKEPRLFCVSGKSQLRTSSTQVKCHYSSLTSRSAFCLVTPEVSYAWAGKGSTQVERRAAAAAARLLSSPSSTSISVVRCVEGDEPEAFWQLLGSGTGRVKYDTELLSPEIAGQQPRLFHCSLLGWRLVTEEIFHFTQLSLTREDVLLLDTGNQVFMWIGEAALQNESQGANKMALDYLASDQTGRKPETTAIHVVLQRYEPITFTSHFLHWDAGLWDQEQSSLEAVEKEVTTKRASMRRASTLSQSSSGSGLSSSHLQVASDLPEIASGVELLLDDPPVRGSRGAEPQTHTHELPTDHAQQVGIQQHHGESAHSDPMGMAAPATSAQPTHPDNVTLSTPNTTEVQEEPSLSTAAVANDYKPDGADKDQTMGQQQLATASSESDNVRESESVEAEQAEQRNHITEPTTATAHTAHPGQDDSEEQSKEAEELQDDTEIVDEMVADAGEVDDVDGKECTVDELDGNSVKADEHPATTAEDPSTEDEPEQLPCGSSSDSSSIPPAEQLSPSPGCEEEQEVSSPAATADSYGLDNKQPETHDLINNVPSAPNAGQAGMSAPSPDVSPAAQAIQSTATDVDETCTQASQSGVEAGVCDNDIGTVATPGHSLEGHRPEELSLQAEVSCPVPVPEAVPDPVMISTPASTDSTSPTPQSPISPGDLEASLSSISLSASNLLSGSSAANLLFNSSFDLDNLDTIPEVRSRPATLERKASGSSPKKEALVPRPKSTASPSEKSVITVLSTDKTAHQVEVTEKSNAQHLVYKMVDKAQVKLTLTLSIVESLADLKLERRLEDHERVLDVMGRWPLKHSNTLQLRNAPSKYALFEKPQLPRPVLLAACDRGTVPDVSGNLWVKMSSQMPWQQHVLSLRSTGIAFTTIAESAEEENEEPTMAVYFYRSSVYIPTGAAKASGAPTKFAFVVKSNGSYDPDNMVSFCAQSAQDFIQWVAAIRLVMFGAQLRRNHGVVRRQFSMLARVKKARRASSQQT